MTLLEKLDHVTVIMIYLTEAHADDVWPLGYGIKSAKSVKERAERCSDFLAKYPQLKSKVDAIFIDNM